MKLNIYFRANESAKSAGSVNEDITQEAYRIGTHTKSDILRAVGYLLTILGLLMMIV